MNKKFIKTFGALAGIGAVASGSAIGLTSCGNSKTIEVTVEKLIETININDKDTTNKQGNIVGQFLVTNKSSDGKIWTTDDVMECILNPNLQIDMTNIAVKAEEVVAEKGIRVTFEIKTVLTNAMIGEYIILIRGNTKYRDFDARTFHIDVINRLG